MCKSSLPSFKENLSGHRSLILNSGYKVMLKIYAPDAEVWNCEYRILKIAL